MALMIEGFGELQSSLDDLTTRFDEDQGAVITAALQAGGQIMLQAINEQADLAFRDRTGALRKSIRVGSIKKNTRMSGRRIEIGSWMGGNQPHNHLVEQGHGGPSPAPAHPYVRPAFDLHSGDAYTAMRQVLEAELKL